MVAPSALVDGGAASRELRAPEQGVSPMNPHPASHPHGFVLHVRLLTAFLVAVVSMLSLPVAYAATITVTTTTDELNSDGDCSLREAIRAANLDRGVDACPAGTATDTITLPPGTYTLTIPGGDEDGALTGDLDI